MQFAVHLIAAGCLSMSMQGNILLLKQPRQRYCFEVNYTFLNDYQRNRNSMIQKVLIKKVNQLNFNNTHAFSIVRTPIQLFNGLLVTARAVLFVRVTHTLLNSNLIKHFKKPFFTCGA
jgi:hypothetical protein